MNKHVTVIVALALTCVAGCAPEPRTARRAILANVGDLARPGISVRVVAGPRAEDGRVFRAVTRDGTFVLMCDSYEDLACGDDITGSLVSRDGDYAPEGCAYATFWTCDNVGWEPPPNRARASWMSFRYFF